MLNRIIFLILGVSTSVTLATYNCSQSLPFNDNIYSCCRSPNIDMKVASDKCIKYVQTLPNPTGVPEYAHVCFPDCIYHETGAMVNGEINIDKVTEFLQSRVKDTEFKPVIAESFRKCLTNIHNHMNAVKIQMYQRLPEGCSPYASLIWHCVNSETFITCPHSVWKNTENCNMARDYTNDCNPLPHTPLPMF